MLHGFLTHAACLVVGAAFVVGEISILLVSCLMCFMLFAVCYESISPWVALRMPPDPDYGPISLWLAHNIPDPDIILSVLLSLCRVLHFNPKFFLMLPITKMVGDDDEYACRHGRFTCSCGGRVHDYKKSTDLQRHLETASHKRKMDSVFAEMASTVKKEKRADKRADKRTHDAVDPVKMAASAELLAMRKRQRALDAVDPVKMAARAEVLAAAKAAAAKALDFTCNCQGIPHDYKSLQAFQRHMNTASHKRNVDPESNKLTHAGTKTAKALAHAKRKHAQRKHYEKSVRDDPISFITSTGTESDVLSALQRYHGSTSAALQLDIDNDDKTKKKIERFIFVAVDVKLALRKKWREGVMAASAPLAACASCGVRDLVADYDEIEVRTLPKFFEFSSKDQTKFDVLKGFCSDCVPISLSFAGLIFYFCFRWC